MTLVELLIVIAIIAILGLAILGVASASMTTAREARTRNMVSRIHSLLAEQYDSYKNRRVKLNTTVQNLVNANQPRLRGEALAQARLYALRELMLMEMPDRWSDVLLNQVGSSAQAPLYYAERTGLSNLYLRRYQQVLPTVENQGAECLYLVIMNATGEGEARSLFGEQDIGDKDGDGAPEFLDAWGNPIEFLRWAPGFDSDLQHDVYEFADDAAWQTAADADHDPFDIFRRDRFGLRLQPLVYSAGNDERYGIDRNDVDQIWHTVNVVTPTAPVAPTYSYFNPRLSLFVPGNVSDSSNNYTGTTIDQAGQRDIKAEDATDNIHNHLIDAR